MKAPVRPSPPVHFSCVSLLLAFVSLSLPAQENRHAGLDEAIAVVMATPAPDFKPGHGLPPLSLWRQMPLDLKQLLADEWGYALNLNPGAASLAAINDPSSETAQLLELVRSDPEHYKLQLTLSVNRGFRDGQADFERYPIWKELPETFLRDDKGELINGRYYFSPLAPDAAIQAVADRWAAKVKAFQESAPVSIILNSGESGFRRSQHTSPDISLQDPAVRKAWADDGRTWVEFLSDRKAHHEKIIRDTIKQVAPDALYIHYSEVGGGHFMRNRRPDWQHWDFEYRPGISDLPSPRYYLGHSNTGFTGSHDVLSHMLMSRAEEIAGGGDLGYFWVFGGNTRRGTLGDPVTYRGFLTTMYTSGAVGGIACWFWGEPLANDEVARESIPQFLALAQTHATFSHLEEFLRNSELLPGPDRHRWSPEFPAYEFPTGHPDKRVVVRRHRDRAEWLVCAWAADGVAAPVRVVIPELGEVEVLASPEGTLRLMTKES